MYDKIKGITLLSENRATVSVPLTTGAVLLQNSNLEAKKLEDLIPKEEDYVNIPFRALSARYLGEAGYFLDFSREGVLKNSIPLMLTETQGGVRKKPLKVQRNHSFAIEDTMGTITEAKWDNSDKFGSPGINVMTRLDWKLYPDEVRKLLSNPPLIESASMSLLFDWEPSHPDLKMWQFFDMLGHEVDGEIVRFIVTDILEYYHMGLVWDGGDAQATMLPEETLQKKMAVAVPSTFQLNRSQIKKEDTMGLEIKNLDALKEVLCLDSLKTEQELLDAVQALADSNSELIKENRELKEMAELGQKHLQALREEVLRKAMLLHENGIEETRKNLIENANYETLQMLDADYDRELKERFPLSCQDCGSTNISTRSSKEELSNSGGDERIDESQFMVGR